jgi:hypothetical protein
VDIAEGRGLVEDEAGTSQDQEQVA